MVDLLGGGIIVKGYRGRRGPTQRPDARGKLSPKHGRLQSLEAGGSFPAWPDAAVAAVRVVGASAGTRPG